MDKLRERLFARTLMYGRMSNYMCAMDKDFSKKELIKVEDRYTFLVNLLIEAESWDEYLKWLGDTDEQFRKYYV